MAWNTLDDMDLNGKRVLVRVDINVPVEDGRVTDTTRIEKIVPTVHDILERGGRPMLLAHFGRPKGKVVPDLSLRVVLPDLQRLLGRDVTLAEDFDGAEAQSGDVVLFENIRFHPGEETNDPEFAARLAKLGDIYVNDAFSCAHRAHASTEGVAHLLPSCAGRQMQAELSALDMALGAPERPVMAVVGGAKVSTKLELLSNIVENTFLAAKGVAIGTSLAEHDMVETAAEIEAKAATTGCEVILPSDIVVAREFKAGAASEVLPASECPDDAMILDAGPDTVNRMAAAMDSAKTLIWNGPMGAFEIEPFDAATNAAAKQAAALTAKGELISVAGGGDTVAALNKAGAADSFTYISTAGGAFLEWMEGKTLPGVAALTK